MSEVKTDKLTGTSTAKTVTVTVGATATQSLEQGLAKAWVTYNSINETTEGSLNQSSLVDESTGRYYSTFTSAFASATDKCAVVSAYNSINNTSASINENRGGIVSNIGVTTGAGTFRALSASEIQYNTSYGSNARSPTTIT